MTVHSLEIVISYRLFMYSVTRLIDILCTVRGQSTLAQAGRSVDRKKEAIDKQNQMPLNADC